MPENSMTLVSEAIKSLADAEVKTWLFGGWAEELLDLRPPGNHRDIDLLYLASDFSLLDEFLRRCEEAKEIEAKRFSHKRAFLWQGVIVEVFLVRPEAAGYVTSFFEVDKFTWPEDTFSFSVYIVGEDYPSASPSALRLYRERHDDVDLAYRRHIAQLGMAR